MVMLTGVLKGMMDKAFAKVPEAALVQQLIEIRAEIDAWIGDAIEPAEDDVRPYHLDEEEFQLSEGFKEAVDGPRPPEPDETVSGATEAEITETAS